MCKKLIFCLIGCLLISQAAFGDYVLTLGNGSILRRLTDTGQTVWETAGLTANVQAKLAPGDDSVVYTAVAGATGNRKVTKFDAATGALIGDAIEVQTGRINELQWGPDYNGDGISDVWTCSQDGPFSVFDGATFGVVLPAVALNTWNIADVNPNDGTGGRSFTFGPDINGDGVGELYACKGYNDANGKINVWDAKTMTKVATYPISECREVMGIIVGPDVNGDGQDDLWIASSRRHEIQAYDYANGTSYGKVNVGVDDLHFPLDVEYGPKGTILIATRFATSLDPNYISDPNAAGYKSNKEYAGGDLVRYDPATGTAVLVYEHTDRIDGIAYIAPKPKADYIITSLGAQSVARFTDTGDLVWETKTDPNINLNLEQLEEVEISPIDGQVYVAQAGGASQNKVVKKLDFETGAYLGEFTAATPDHRNCDIQWGYDYNQDGAPDMWMVSKDGLITVNDGITGILLGQNKTADVNPNDGAGGRACTFGPDITGDGIGELFVCKGYNDANNKINIWNPVTLTKVGEIAIKEIRECQGIILGPDVNGDGQQDLWVASQRRNECRTYDYLTGAELSIEKAGISFRNMMDVDYGPDGTVLMVSRFATTLDPDFISDPNQPGYKSNTEYTGGDVIKYDPNSGTAELVVEYYDRIDSVAYVPRPLEPEVAPVTFSTTAPTPGQFDISNFVGPTLDSENVGGNPDESTYVAFDRAAQGQTFLTGDNAAGYVMSGFWVRHVAYVGNPANQSTWYMMPVGSQLGIRVTDPAASGTDAFVLASQIYTITGDEPNVLPAELTNTNDGTGTWIHITLDEPVSLAANKLYGFDLLGIRTTGYGADLFFETAGIDDSAPGGNPYPDGTAYTSGLDGSADNVLNPQPGDRVFLVELDVM